MKDDREKTYIAIDLKSFYASVECIERELDPLTTNLVVADISRTEKTICLAVSPSLKSYGISGRARLFEVIQKLKEVNFQRLNKLPSRSFVGKSIYDNEIKDHPELEIDFIAATPRMALYISYSTRIYEIYLKYVAPEDIHVYSIDEVFIDATEYLQFYNMSAHDFTMMLIKEVLEETGITATAGIGTNLYLCKVAMDIVAKHVKADEDGVRIAEIDEMSYRKKLWNHKPITDFWRVGKGYAARLANNNMYTMGDVARCSVYNEDLLYKLFGVNAELLIDHAWGWEPCGMEDVKEYRPSNHSFCASQVLAYPYEFEAAKMIVREMADSAALDLVSKGMVTNQLILTVSYDITSLSDSAVREKYKGEIKKDYYGRKAPKHAHGTANLKKYSSSSKKISEALLKLYDEIVNPDFLVRRISITENNVVYESEIIDCENNEQLDFFTDYDELKKLEEAENEELEKERRLQETMLAIKGKYGKNAAVKAMNLREGATAINRNNQIGGHKA